MSKLARKAVVTATKKGYLRQNSVDSLTGKNNGTNVGPGSPTLHLEPWQPETARTKTISYAWKPDTWYRMKLQVDNLPDGKTRARGKVWPASEAEPAQWMIERVDPIPNRQGAPGIFGNGLAELYFDNVKVYANK